MLHTMFINLGRNRTSTTLSKTGFPVNTARPAVDFDCSILDWRKRSSLQRPVTPLCLRPKLRRACGYSHSLQAHKFLSILVAHLKGIDRIVYLHFDIVYFNVSHGSISPVDLPSIPLSSLECIEEVDFLSRNVDIILTIMKIPSEKFF